MMKIGLGMKQELHMAPILKLTVAVGQIRAAFQLGESIRVFCPKDRDAENEFGDGMADLRTRDFGIAADLNRQIDERNHNTNRADDLSEVGEVVEIHVSQLVVVGQALRLPKPKMATDAVALQFQLAIVLGGVEVAFRFRDESVPVDLPKFVAVDSNAFARASRSGVGSG
jgi:hypothetical protein